MRKFILLGATGLLGQAITKEAKKRGNIELVGVARSNADVNIDITQDNALRELIEKEKPDVVINTCAIVNHKLCDDDAGMAYTVNARPNAILAELSKELGFYFVYISTDGYYHQKGNAKNDENEKIFLLNEYARTKYCGEMFTLTSPTSLVTRTNIVGFKRDKNQPTFVEWALNALKNQEKMNLFNDYYTSSISVTQFSKALFDLIDKKTYGLINLASSEVSSKADFITALANEFGYSLKNATLGSVTTLNSKRADSLGLDVSKAEKILGYKLPSLNEVIKQLKTDFEEKI